MANVTLQAATTNYVLGNSGTYGASLKIIQLTVGALVGSFVVMARLTGSGHAFKPIPYRSRYLNGAVGTDAYVTTAITGDSIIEVNAAGLDIQLAYAHTSGSIVGALLSFADTTT